MRTVLTLALFALVARGAEEAMPSAGALSLRAAIHRSLSHNLGLASARLDAAKTLDALELAESGFDLRLSWSHAFGSVRSLTEVDAGLPPTNDYQSTLTLTQPFSWGGQLSLSGSADRFGPANGGASVDVASVGTSLSYTQPLLRGGWGSVNLAPVVAARLGATRSLLQLRSAALDLMRDTESAYWGLSAARATVTLQTSSLRSAESLLAEVVERRRLGAATLQEQLQAEADVANQQVALLSARQQADSADTQLRQLLGLDGSADGPAEVAVDALPIDFVGAIADYRAWLGQVLAFDLAAQIQQTAVETAQSELEAARMNDHPRLDLTVATSFASDPALFRQIQPAWNSLSDRHSTSTSAALVLSFPVGSRDTESALRLATRSRRQADLRLADVRQSLTFSARAAWRDLDAARARCSAAQAALDLQRRVYDGERARYSAGVAAITQVLQARAALDSAQFTWVKASLDARVASTRVARLDGTLLSRHGFTWDTAEQGIGSGMDVHDPLPTLSTP